jgi:hypothetical protein
MVVYEDPYKEVVAPKISIPVKKDGYKNIFRVALTLSVKSAAKKFTLMPLITRHN